MEIKEITFKSSSGLCDIWARRFVNPDTKPTVIIQLLHGMVENSSRYDYFIQTLCDEGYVVYMHDHLGHGKSVASEDDLGYFGEDEDAYMHLVEDAHTLTDIAWKTDTELPVILFGHSMGSFVCRLYTAKYGDELAGAIFCGTAGKNAAAGAGIKLAKGFMKAKGSHFRCNMLTHIAFMRYNKRTDNETPSDWLCCNKEIVEKYNNDPECGFTFTTNGYHALFKMVYAIAQKKWYEAVPADLPILLMAGMEDPVGDYGKGVREVHDTLKATGHANVSMNLYAGDRHEILNEFDREKVIADTLDWISNTLNQ